MEHLLLDDLLTQKQASKVYIIAKNLDTSHCIHHTQGGQYRR